MYLQKLKRFLIRISIYQIVLLWSFIKFNNVEKHSGEFKEKIMRNLSYFGMQNREIGEILQDPSYLFFLCILEIICGVLGIFGSFYGNLLSALLFLISSTIYFNPLLPENQFSLYNIRTELFYNIGIFISLILCAYFPYPQTNKGKVINTSIDDEDLENEEDTNTRPIVETPAAQNQTKNVKKIKKNK